MPEAYDACPCGSGKKFKWCCQPIYGQIQKAFDLDEKGQHDTALRLMEEVTREHGSNPEVWGRQAQMLYQNGQIEQAESALDKAFEINPHYPFGHLLRANFRQNEGELRGALLLYRKAAELYDADAKAALAGIQTAIAQLELMFQRPVAARAALQLALRLSPVEETQATIDQLFGEESPYPIAARKEYAFLPFPKDGRPERRAAWTEALTRAATGKMGDAVRAFEQLTQSDPDNSSAWYNLGLVNAWLGENAAAISALDRYVSLETDEEKASAAWTLAEVLRLGQGLMELADYVDSCLTYRIQDVRGIESLLSQLSSEHLLAELRKMEQEGLLAGIILERGTVLAMSGPQNQPLKLGCHFILSGQYLRIWNTSAEAVERMGKDLERRAGATLSTPQSERKVATFADILQEGLIFLHSDEGTISEETQIKFREQGLKYLEERWAQRPLKSLDGKRPLEAAAQPGMRKKLVGVVRFLEQCAPPGGSPFNFDHLKIKLGLASAGPTAAATAEPDIEGLDADALGKLNADVLNEGQLEKAFRTALRLDAHEPGIRFAKGLVARAPAGGSSDAYAPVSYLVQRALAAGDTDAALGHVDEGEKLDCERNEGRRRNDYELRRGQVLAKRGDAEAAQSVFERLVQRVPDDFKIRGAAVESMLSMKQSAHALRFAEDSLKKARELNNRDSEQYFMELVAAARKQGG
jgi:tetratricopeptide (TPR) repeat protein